MDEVHPTVLSQGAEARLYLGVYKNEQCLIKERFVKKYRHPELDTQISRQRIKAETKAIERCQNAGILTPRILHTDLNERKIYMQYYDDATTAKAYIRRIVVENDAIVAQSLLVILCHSVGVIVGKMHANNIIHGDLTTSNILIKLKDDQNLSKYDVIFIDFGLSHYSQSAEDKAVDLYVLERALLSTHSEQSDLFEKILQTYRKTCGKDENVVLAKFEEVRARGRKRTMIG